MKIRVGGAQLGPGNDCICLNMHRIIKYIDEAEKLNIDLFCLPELCMTNYFPKKHYEKLDDFILSDDHSLVRQVIEKTTNLQVAVVFPYAESTSEGIFNTAIIISQGEIIGKYRKIHLPILKKHSKYNNFEEEYFTAGNLGFPVFEVKGIKVGLQICFDRHFPEGFRILGIKGADVVFVPTNSAAFDDDPNRYLIWERLMQIRSYENSIHIVTVNKAGNEEHWDFMGNSMITDPSGEIIKKLSKKEESIFYSDILVKEGNTKGKFFSKRQPDKYNELIV